MSEDFRVTGAEQFRALGKDLKAMGEDGKELRRELLKTLRMTGKPLIEKVRASARANLPKSGGLNEFIASSKFTTRNDLAGKKVGTRITVTKPGGSKGWHDVEAFDNGTFRHPTFGRKTWVRQTISGGFFTKPMTESAPEFQRALLAAMAITERKITK